MKIESLTQEQIERFPEFVKKWTEIGLCTDPANRNLAEQSIRRAYEIVGLKPPTKIIWCGSPLSAVITIESLRSVRDSVGASVRDSVGASVRDSVGASVRASVRDSVGASVGDSVWDSVRASVWASVGASVRASVRASVGASVRASVRDSVGASVRDSVGASVRASVLDSVGASVRASVLDSVGASVLDSVGASVLDSVRASVWASVWGQHDASWLGFYDYFRDVLHLEASTASLEGLWGVARSANWWFPYQNICFVCERHHVLNRDAQGRLHSLNSAALSYPDGFSIYAVHGVRVPSWIITHPQKITVAKIEAEDNAEIRRVMMEIYGFDRYIRNSKTKPIHRDETGVLYRRDIPDDEPLVMVCVKNSTPEPDGRYKSYWLRVPPSMRTAREAVAWTFGLSEQDYRILRES